MSPEVKTKAELNCRSGFGDLSVKIDLIYFLLSVYFELSCPLVAQHFVLRCHLPAVCPSLQSQGRIIDVFWLCVQSDIQTILSYRP